MYEPSTDGLSLNTYTGADRNNLDINGELNKLAYNVVWSRNSCRHTLPQLDLLSIQLGEQIALSVLQDRGRSYNEPFNIQITKFDGTMAVISNQ